MFDRTHIAALSQTLVDGTEADLYPRIEDLAADAIGFRMLTVMRYDPASSALGRVYSNNPENYPVGGSKVKPPSPWKQRLLEDCQPVLSNDREALRRHFDDHAKLFELGIEAILNIPVVHRGACVGTLNLGHRAGWFTDEHVQTGVVLGALLEMALAR